MIMVEKFVHFFILSKTLMHTGPNSQYFCSKVVNSLTILRFFCNFLAWCNSSKKRSNVYFVAQFELELEKFTGRSRQTLAQSVNRWWGFSQVRLKRIASPDSLTMMMWLGCSVSLGSTNSSSFLLPQSHFEVLLTKSKLISAAGAGIYQTRWCYGHFSQLKVPCNLEFVHFFLR